MSRDMTPRELYMVEKTLVAKEGPAASYLEVMRNMTCTVNGRTSKAYTTTQISNRQEFKILGTLFSPFDNLYDIMANGVPFGMDVLHEQDDIVAKYAETGDGDKESVICKWFDGKLDEGFYYNEQNDDKLFVWLIEEAKKRGDCTSDMTLTTFKRLAKEKPVFLELVWRYDRTGEEIPENIRGKRKIAKVRSYGFDLVMADRPDSRTKMLRIESAAQFCLEGDTLKVFNSGYREATDEEQAMFNGWHKIQKQHEDDPFWDGYQKMKDFFRNEGKGKDYSYLIHARRNMRLGIYGNELIYDLKVRGPLALQYKVTVGGDGK